MNEILGRCGYRCDLCPAYKDNIHGPEDRQRVSDGWFKYYGFRIPPEEIYCDGCRDEKVNAKRIDAECKVRQCAMELGMANCAHCDKYICEELSKKIVDPEEVSRRFDKPIPQQDCDCFVKPYDNKKTLDSIRKDMGKRK